MRIKLVVIEFQLSVPRLCIEKVHIYEASSVCLLPSLLNHSEAGDCSWLLRGAALPAFGISLLRRPKGT